MRPAVLNHVRTPMPGIFLRLAQLRGERGNALMEVAVILAILGPPLLLGTCEMGTVIYDSIEIANAAHAGALVGMTGSGPAVNSNGEITTAAQQEAPDFGAKLTVTPTVFFVCSSAESGAQYSGQDAANAACGSTQTSHPLEFVKVAVSAPVTPAIHCPGLPSTFTLRNTSVMEVEE